MPNKDHEKQLEAQRKHYRNLTPEQREKLREYSKNWKRAHKEQHSAQFKRWYHERGGKEHQSHRYYGEAQRRLEKNRRYLRTYGITLDDYENRYNELHGNCEICSQHQEKLQVDHDHKTGKFRGLLCGLCNRTLGHIRDNVDGLRRCIEYLERS